ncbi:hypothetical protein P3G55_00435 [Leptospira sp. 96542]|nr:hypothetical protein [Leptospira sp. 96542]
MTGWGFPGRFFFTEAILEKRYIKTSFQKPLFLNSASRPKSKYNMQKITIFLSFILILHCATHPTTNPNLKLANQYDEWAGFTDSDPGYKNDMELHWKKLNSTNESIRAYLKLKNFNPNPDTVIYPFSGIDVLNLFSFFPTSKHYILFGLEDPGFPYDYDSLTEKEKKIVKTGIKNLSEHLANRNYFTYRKMKEETKKPELNGAFPVFVAFLKRMGKEVVSEKEESIQGAGIIYKGWSLVLFDKKSKQTQTLTYYKIFLTGKEGVPGDGLYEYFSQFKKVGIFTKSAEYLFHGERRKNFRNLLLQNATTIVQDESGFPIRFFPNLEWDRQIFGRYERSWTLSGAVDPENQPELKKLSESTNDPILPFPFGYGYLGTKDNRQSAVLVFQKK